MPFLALLGNKNVWIVIIILGVVGGVWFKINGLEKAAAKAKQELAVQVETNRVLAGNNATLHQNLDLALAVNDANAKILDSVKRDQELAAASLKRLSTDLSASKLTLNEARARLAATTMPLVPVPQRIVDAIITIQDSRVTQAKLNKQVEDGLK